MCPKQIVAQLPLSHASVLLGSVMSQEFVLDLKDTHYQRGLSEVLGSQATLVSTVQEEPCARMGSPGSRLNGEQPSFL